MRPSLTALLAAIRSSLQTRAQLEAEILALRHKLAVLQQTAPRRLQLSRAARFLWVLLSRVWSRWREAVQIVQPATVVSWHRRLFVSNSLLGGHWELDEIPAVRDPAHMVQIGTDHRTLTGKGQRRVTV